MHNLHIGVDLDNTLINYDHVFAEVGVEIGLLPADYDHGAKEEIKAYLFSSPGGEEDWMRLQGQVYGRNIGRAKLFEGAEDFLKTACLNGARVSIVSHKTRYGHFDPDRIDLWDAALDWLDSRDFFGANGLDLDPNDVHFRETLDGKIEQISEIGCKFFVDDLPRVLNHERFPSNVGKFWFASTQAARAGCGLVPYRSWAEVKSELEKNL